MPEPGEEREYFRNIQLPFLIGIVAVEGDRIQTCSVYSVCGHNDGRFDNEEEGETRSMKSPLTEMGRSCSLQDPHGYSMETAG